MEEDVKRWLTQAEEDLDSAEKNLEIRKYNLVAFLCQQSVEKGLKSLSIKNTGKYQKIHDLVMLARLNKAPENIIKLCAKITPAYVATRYPDSAKKYSKDESNKVLSYTKEVLRWIKENLN